MDIIKKLMVRPMGVETRSLNSLDLAIYMKHVDLSKRVLSDIFEYRWLSRAETDRRGTVIEESESVEVSSVVSGCELAKELLPGSKVVDAFSRKNGLSKRLALKEFSKRAEFLRVLNNSCKNTKEMLEKIQGYGW